ncbi:MAG: 50S ribosomal protein L2 [Candidatus Peregrinibacteria bacterium]
MAVKIYKPTTPGRRNMSVVDYSVLTKTKPEKTLLVKKVSTSGRNAHGHITIRHRGGGVKRHYRLMDFKRFDRMNIPATVASIEYDPNRTSFICLLHYADGVKRYILAPEGIHEGDIVMMSEQGKAKPGNRMTIRNIPVGYSIHDLELTPGKGGQLIRSAGSYGKVTSLDAEMAHIQLASGEVRLISKDCYATIGVVSNSDHANVKLGKAGRVRMMGRRPQVLGKSMNAVDHPHGGGEGHSPIGMKAPKTPWGAPALGHKTRRRKKASSQYIISGRKK